MIFSRASRTCIPDIAISPVRSRVSSTPAAPLFRYSLFYSLFSSLKGFFHILYRLSGHNMHPVHPGRYLYWKVQKSLKGGNSGGIHQGGHPDFLNFLKRRPSRICLPEHSWNLFNGGHIVGRIEGYPVSDGKIPLKEFFQIFSLEHSEGHIYRRVSIHVFFEKTWELCKKV